MKIKHAIIGLTLIVLTGICFADDQTNAQETEHQRLVQAYTEAIQKGNENFNQNPYKISDPFPNAKSDAKKKTNTKPAKKKSISQCNCYDNSNAYNYPSNFYYSKDRKRIRRIEPACLCEQSDDNSVLPVVNTPSTQSQDQTDASDEDNSNDEKPSIGTIKLKKQQSSGGGITGSLSNNSPNNNGETQNSNKNNFNFGISYN